MKLAVLATVLSLSTLAHAKPADEAAIRATIDSQLKAWQERAEHPNIAMYTKDAVIITIGLPPAPTVIELGDPDYLGLLSPAGIIRKVGVKDFHVGIARDGQSAWASLSAKISYETMGGADVFDTRGSELLVKGPSGWLIQGGFWSIGQKDAPINAAAKAGALGSLDEVTTATVGDPTVVAAYQAVFAVGFDATAAASKELIGIGSAPGEMTVGGKALAPGFKAAWVKHVAVNAPIRAAVTPSGTTAYAISNVVYDKGKYKIPFRILVVFDKVDGAWSVTHIHFSVPAV